MKTVILLLLACSATATRAQLPTSSPLFRQLQQHDSLFFDRAFNRCDLPWLDSATHPGLLFYHDQGGPQDKAEFLRRVRQNICGNPAEKPVRLVDETSLQVYPLYNDGQLYGAIQMGIHHFYLRRPQQPDVATSTARFTHVWLWQQGRWLLKEVLSYDHQAPRGTTAK